jgi:hypothetical protein
VVTVQVVGSSGCFHLIATALVMAFKP